MDKNLSRKNTSYWQIYKPGEIPSVPVFPPEKLLSEISGLVLDVGTGDGVLAEEMASRNLEVYGIDIAINIIQENQKRDSKVKYSIQDITDKTDFPDNYFSLIVIRFVLTNIHKESWESLSSELYRVLKKNGKIWVLEPLVSDSYKSRYDLSKNFIEDSHCVYVFKDKELASKVKSIDDLNDAIKNDQVSRIVKHYTIEELNMIFDKFTLDQGREIDVKSPSGYSIKTFEGIYLK